MECAGRFNLRVNGGPWPSGVRPGGGYAGFQSPHIPYVHGDTAYLFVRAQIRFMRSQVK